MVFNNKRRKSNCLSLQMPCRRLHHLTSKSSETSIKSQITKSVCRNYKNSCTPITHLKRAKSRTNCHSQLLQKENKIPRNTTNQGVLQGELQITAPGKKRGHKKMEKHSKLKVRKNQYCENGHTAQSNL